MKIIFMFLKYRYLMEIEIRTPTEAKRPWKTRSSTVAPAVTPFIQMIQGD